MFSRWFIFVNVSLLLLRLVNTIEMENVSMINEESTTRLSFKIDDIGDGDSDLTVDVDRSTKLDNETQINNSISNGTKKVCGAKNCTDYPMTRDSLSKESKEQGEEDTLPLTFSQLNSSEFNNMSLESSSPSSFSSTATFHHLQTNSEQRKSYDLNTINSLHQTIQKVIMMVVKRISSMYGFNPDTDANSNKLQDKIDDTDEPSANITKLFDSKINATVNSHHNIKEISSLNRFSDIILAAKFDTNFTAITPTNTTGNKRGVSPSKTRIYHAKKVKRSVSRERWISKLTNKEDGLVEMHAFVVRDEIIPSCCNPALAITNKRYFMCSGAILTATHAITTASCMHFADLYEQHIDAELAVLVGASTSAPFVIKINRYEMHPNYVYNVDSRDHPTYNVAILFLNCGFSFVTGIIEPPKLPKGIYDDVGHMCCSQKCQLLTVIQKVNNHHLIKLIEAQHLPPPVHDDERLMLVPRRNFGLRRLYRLKRSVFSWIRRKRNPVKLAPAPSFLSKDTSLFVENNSSGKKVQTKRQNEVTKRKKKTKDILDVIADAKKVSKNKKQKTFDINDLKSVNGRRKFTDGLKERIVADLMQVDEKLTSVDWSKIEEETKPKIPESERGKIEKFAKEIVDETMGRLEGVLETNLTSDAGNAGLKHKGNSTSKNILLSLMGESKTPETLDNFAEIFSNVIRSVLPPKNSSRITVSSDITIEKKDLTEPRSKYHKCPPLGSPVFRNGTLVAMVAYTCDDVESWVEWKYVSISKNLNWIRQRTEVPQNQKPTLCISQFTETDIPDGDLHSEIEDIQKSSLFKKQSPAYLETFDNTYKPIDESLKGVRETSNENAARTFMIPNVHPKLPEVWPPGSTNPTKNPSWTSALSSNKGKFVAVSNVNSNTCFTKPDGSTDCRTVSNTYTLE